MADVDTNTFKILLATDNHLGYGENNSNIENDSFITFEEILKIAVKENVDFILLGGDLFHEVRPSPYCFNRCTELIRKYCLGDKCVEFQALSDPSINFERNAIVNYEDPNMNISIPIFSIHGNHDDPSGKKQMSALDLMATNGLVNYFGRANDITNVEVKPVLLRKGDTFLALYGLSHIRDERLSRLFISKKVKMRTPSKVDDWFNLMILHQNRANRGVKNFIAESCLPDFMNFVMWGHEHDCKIVPTTLDSKPHIYITQPGSSVATSLAEGEGITKHVGILRVMGKKFSLTPVELRTVRPLIYDTITLDPPQIVVGKLTHADRARAIVKKEVEKLIKRASDLGRNNLRPLIRLNVRYQDERQIFNAIRFGQEFIDIVANPEDIIKFHSLIKKQRVKNIVLDEFEDNEETMEDIEAATNVEDLISKYLEGDNGLNVLSLPVMLEATRKYVEGNDKEALSDAIAMQEEEILKKLIELKPKPNEGEIDEYLKHIDVFKDTNEIQNLLNDVARREALKIKSSLNDPDTIVLDDDDDGDDGSKQTTPAKGPGSRGGRGSRRGRSSRGPRTSRGGRGSRTAKIAESTFDF